MMAFRQSLIAAAVLASVFSGSSFAAGNTDTWTVISPDGKTSQVINASGQSVARAQIDILRKKGILTGYAQIDDGSHTVRILLATPAATGALSGYIPKDKDLNLATLNRDMPLIRDAARAQGGEPSVQVGAVRGEALPIQTSIVPDPSTAQSGAVLSSYGPRYSGENVASLFATGHFAKMIGSITYSEGLAFLTPSESRGGYYHGISGDLKRPTPYGEIVTGGSYARYKEGGNLEPLDITGSTTQIYAGYERPFDFGTPGIRLYYGKQTSNIGVAGIDGEQSYTAVRLGFSRDHQYNIGFKSPLIAHISASFTQGLSADDGGYALGRLIQSDFRVGQVDMLANQSLGNWMVALAAGGQAQVGREPLQLDFYLGGANRGSGYRTGAASAPSGAYGSARLYTPSYAFNIKQVPIVLRPFVGYNQAVGRPMVGDTLRAASAEVGTQINVNKRVSGEIGYARITDHQGVHENRGRAIFNIVMTF